MDRILEIITKRPEETFELGKRFARYLTAGDVVAMDGELGTGKTVLIQGICSGLDVTSDVTSPTFTLIQEYKGRFPVFHFDFYRLDTITEIEDLDLDYYFNSGGISLIEWAGKGEKLLPTGKISVLLDWKINRKKIAASERKIRFFKPDNRSFPGLVS